VFSIKSLVFVKGTGFFCFVNTLVFVKERSFFPVNRLFLVMKMSFVLCREETEILHITHIKYLLRGVKLKPARIPDDDVGTLPKPCIS